MARKTEFENVIRYKLYRKVSDIIHPSISKKNISDYKIVFEDSLLPVRVFYPNKISKLSGIIIYIPGDGNLTKCTYEYATICSDLAKELDKLILAVDYFEHPNNYPSILDKVEQIVKYLYKELETVGIEKQDIILMGDSSGGNFVSSITFRFIKEKIDYINKEILLYPLLSGDYDENSKFKSIGNGWICNKELVNKIQNFMSEYTKLKKNRKRKDICPLLNKDYSHYPTTLVITGDLDPLRDEGVAFYKKLNNTSMYQNIKDASHGFLNTKDLKIRHEYLSAIKKFI